MNSNVIYFYYRWKAFVYLPYSPVGAQVVHVASWKPGYGLVPANGHTLFPEKYRKWAKLNSIDEAVT